MPPSRTRNYLAGLFTGYTVMFATIAVGFWLTPYTLRFLDREEYAIFALTGDLLMWLNLLDLGITAGFRVQVAQLTGRPDQNLLNRMASTAFFTQMGVAGLVALAGAGLVIAFPSFFNVRPDIRVQAMQVVGLLVLGQVLTMGTQTFSALLVAHQQIHIDNLIRLALVAIRTLITVTLLQAGWQMLSLVVANIAAIIITVGLAVIRCYRSLPGLDIRYGLASWEQLKSLGNLGIWFSLGGLAGIFIESLDRVVAARLISLESVTTLSLTGRVYILAYSLLRQITSTARPALGQLMGQGKLDSALLNYHRLVTLTTGGAIVLAFSLWAGNAGFVTWWVGSQNYGGPYLDLAFALNLIVNCWVLPNRATLSAGMIVRSQAICRIVEAVFNLGLGILLGIYIGLPGIVVSTSITGIVTSCWYLPLQTANLFNKKFYNFFINDSMRLIFVAILLFILSYYLKKTYFILNIIETVILASITFLIGVFLIIMIFFNNPIHFFKRISH